MRVFRRFLPLALVLASALPLPAAAQTANVNTSAFALSSNIMFPARTNRSAIWCQNALTNNAATVIYDGFSLVLQPGDYWERIGIDNANNAGGRVPQGVVTATGTSTQVLNCGEIYR